jgi:hypothetical protein
MLRLRVFHRYLGVFFMPSILFFAFTGALQTFGLHESAQRGEPPPVAWIAALAAVHKEQHLAAPAPPRKAGPTAGRATGAPHKEDADEGKSALPLKLFTLLMSIGLGVTSLLGMVLALSNPRTRKASAAILVAGVVIPLLLLFL